MATGTSGDERDDKLTDATSGAVDAEPTDETDADETDAGTSDGDAADSAEDTSVASKDADEEADSEGDDSADSEAAAAAAGSKTVVKDKRQKQGKTAKRSEAESAAKNERKQGRLARFFSEVMAELKKVVTPTKQELWRYVAVVVGFLIIIMALVALFDFVANYLASWAFGQGTELFPQQPAETPVQTIPAG